MKFTLSWLKSHLDTQASVAEISERLTMVGLEVESVEDPAARLAAITVARILEAKPHPNADRLRVCTVESAAGTLQIVCGAPNARAGLKVALALPGTVIPESGETLKKGVIRGVESQGMMCSWRELGLGEDHSGIIELESSAEVGAKLADVVGFDPVFDVAITPNRADCLSVRGVARDLAASGLGALKPMDIQPAAGKFKSPINVDLRFAPGSDPACSLFVGRTIRGVHNGESPEWLKKRLAAIGLRPISALVDITNLLTHDQARPLHVYDVAKVKGVIHARLAKAGESFAALNGKSYVVDSEMCVIADDAGVLGLGGVVGGESSGCSETTTDVFVESALFDPRRIAYAGRTLAIDSDARYRFERDVDPAFCIPGMEWATRLITEICGGEPSDLVIAGQVPDRQRSIVLRPHRVGQLGGVDVPKAEMERILAAIGCTVAEHGDGLLVSPPSFRADITAEHDLVEEVIRLWGYDKIVTVSMPKEHALPRAVLTPSQRRASLVRRSLATRGLIETVTWSFLPAAQAEMFGGGAEQLRLANPISADLDCMRPSVLPNLIAAAARNADRGMGDCALFELGPQYAGDRPEDQAQVASGLRAGRASSRHWAVPARTVDAFDAKADALAALAAAGVPAEAVQVYAEAPAWYHPGRSGALKQGNKVLAWFGELHPRVLKAFDAKGAIAAFEVRLDQAPLPKARPSKARALLKASPFQPLERDFAFVVDVSVAAEALARAARGADKALISGVTVFDKFEGESLGAGRKSLALAVTLQPLDKTLTDAEIEAVGRKIVDAVTKATGATLRG